MSILSESVKLMETRLSDLDFAKLSEVNDVVSALVQRKSLPLDDLSPSEQSDLLAERLHTVQPGDGALSQRLSAAHNEGRPFIAKLGIDPTGSEVHLGHAVPMLVLSRIQRMGHRVVFIVGDVTAKIGDPSGRSDERPPLTDEKIAANLATYKEQVSPFFDFEKAEFRHNGDWLRNVTLPKLIEIASQIPVSMPLQREDFRKRLDENQGLSLAELLYSVVMALDSVEIKCDVELGGIDQLLNMQMCRKVMSICGQESEIVLATALIDGTDGSGAKMSKSRGNYIPVSALPSEIFGKIMSIPDHLTPIYLGALTELRDSEISILLGRLAAGSIHPMDAKRFLAMTVVGMIHGIHAPIEARKKFDAQFSRRNYGMIPDLPLVKDMQASLASVLIDLGFATSNSEARRIAKQSGLRLVFEKDDDRREVLISPDDVLESVQNLVDRQADEGNAYLRSGRQVARIGS